MKRFVVVAVWAFSLVVTWWIASPQEVQSNPIATSALISSTATGSLEAFEAALSAEGWDQDMMDALRWTLTDATALSRALNDAKIPYSQALSRWNGGVSADVATLPAGFEIPNPTNLAGTAPIVKENLQNNIMAYVADLQVYSGQAYMDNVLPLVGSVNLP